MIKKKLSDDFLTSWKSHLKSFSVPPLNLLSFITMKGSHLNNYNSCRLRFLILCLFSLVILAFLLFLLIIIIYSFPLSLLSWYSFFLLPLFFFISALVLFPLGSLTLHFPASHFPIYYLVFFQSFSVFFDSNVRDIQLTLFFFFLPSLISFQLFSFLISITFLFPLVSHIPRFPIF